MSHGDQFQQSGLGVCASDRSAYFEDQVEEFMQAEQAPGTKVIRVLVADSTRIHTQLLASALKSDTGLSVFSSVLDSQELLVAANQYHIDVVAISSNLDQEPLKGFEILRELLAAHPSLRAIVLLDSSKRETIIEAFRAGARGIFSRQESVETLCKCVRSVSEGQIWANSQQMSYAVEALASTPSVRAVDANGFNLLSKRELEVVHSLAEGLTNREIAERLGLSQHTIKNYLFRVFDKLGVSSRIELLFMTLSQGNPLAPPVNGNRPAAPTLELYQKAAEEGLPTAQIRLAEAYASGIGAPKDATTAYMWYLVGEKTSLEMRDEIAAAKRKLAASLTQEQVRAAQDKAAARLKKRTASAGDDLRAIAKEGAQLIAGVVCCATAMLALSQ